ncbi:MAG TPA: hypothetical protein PK478_01935 [Nitrospira sp.]|jgi:hypothetical protein|nr:hypothetical protein [Nitrospira sp.]HQW88577.1 hypothetical protein [Nitrospira sp.]
MLGWMSRRAEREAEQRRRHMDAWLWTFDPTIPAAVRVRGRQMVLDAARRDRTLAAWILDRPRGSAG